MSQPSDLVPSREAAKIAKVSLSTWHRIVERQEVRPAMKAPGLRGAFMFRRADVERFARKRAAA